MRQLKQVLNAQNLLNPGKIFDWTIDILPDHLKPVSSWLGARVSLLTTFFVLKPFCRQVRGDTVGNQAVDKGKQGRYTHFPVFLSLSLPPTRHAHLSIPVSQRRHWGPVIRLKTDIRS